MTATARGDGVAWLTAERACAARWFGVLGAVGIIGGGLVSAATGPLSWEHGSWAAAYLVLVVGVAQLAFGVGQSWLAGEVPAGPVLAGELIGWNVGSALVIAGAVLERPVVVDVGGALLVVALVLFALAVRRGRAEAVRAARTARLAYLLLVVVILVSIPIGLVLAAVDGS